ncbi:hypothetical protein [Neolewinella antarctica]|uniref:ATP synthase F0 subunit 8 n=1 Tax=Neolewinella antarctica TaxID=442734 RepID=A0ABX0XCZ7_9BACT|nr:hypothetical protein [Neolewinella antarctica]NJC26794.1 hypothetical protein [Neolewinella antarctica]
MIYFLIFLSCFYLFFGLFWWGRSRQQRAFRKEEEGLAKSGALRKRLTGTSRKKLWASTIAKNSGQSASDAYA